MTRGILIPFDNDLPIREVEFNSLQDMYRLIECDTVDRITSPNLTFWLDDEGLFHPDRAQRLNARAMQLLCHDSNATVSDLAVALVGNYLIDGPCDAEGNETDVPDWVGDFDFTWTSKVPEATDG